LDTPTTTPPEDERRLLELMLQELRLRSQTLVNQIDQLTQSLGERRKDDLPTRSEDDDAAERLD
jgi:hypothetical protein